MSIHIVYTVTVEGYMKKRKVGKVVLIVLFFIVNILIVYYIARDSFRNDTTLIFGTMFHQWMSHWSYFVLALLMPFVLVAAVGLKYFVMILNTTKKPRLGLAMKTAAIGKYYDNITPLGTGGQPFQVYYLYKNGISAEKSGVMPAVAVTTSQLTLVILNILTFIFYGDVVNIPVLKIAAYGGTAFSLIFPIIVFTFALFPKFTIKVANGTLVLLYKMHFIKNLDRKKAKVEEYLNEFKTSMKYITQSISIIVPLFLLSVVIFLALFSVPYFAIKASGFDVSYIEVTSMCVFVYAAIAFIPTPGNSGGAEISFKIIFTILSGGLLFWTMILWRFASYFMVIIVGLMTLIYDFGLKKAFRRLS